MREQTFCDRCGGPVDNTYEQFPIAERVVTICSFCKIEWENTQKDFLTVSRDHFTRCCEQCHQQIPAAQLTIFRLAFSFSNHIINEQEVAYNFFDKTLTVCMACAKVMAMNVTRICQTNTTPDVPHDSIDIPDNEAEYQKTEALRVLREMRELRDL